MPVNMQSLFATFGELRKARDDFADLYQEVSDYLLPKGGEFAETKVRGQRRRRKIYDSTAGQALDLAASGLYSHATNPSAKWFHLRTQSPEANRLQNTQIWLEDTRDVILQFLNPAIAAPSFEVYRSLLGYGTAGSWLEGNKANDGLFAKHFRTSSLFIAENFMGEVDTMFRPFVKTARQAAQMWPGRAALFSQELQKALASSPEQPFTFIHSVFPRTNRVAGVELNENKPWADFVWEWSENNNLPLAERPIIESGHDEQPFMIPRIGAIDGEIYGRGPGVTALPDIRSLNALAYLKLDAANMAIRPPVDVPHEAYITPFRMSPAAINVNQDPTRRATPMQITGDPRIANDDIENLRASIRAIFFNDQLQLVGGPQMTATEVLERRQLQLMLMAPWHGRLEREYFSIKIDRAFGVLGRQGKFLPLPPELAGMRGSDLDIVYDSPLARASRQADVNAIDKALEAGLALAQTGAMDNFDVDGAVRRRSVAVGYPADLMVPEEVVIAQRQQRQAVEAQQLAMEQTTQGASAVKDLAQAGATAGPEGEVEE